MERIRPPNGELVAEVRLTKLISEKIEVETGASEGGVLEPVAFTWQGRRYEVRAVLRAWVDHGFGTNEVTRTWFNRRHRNYYRVEADDGKVYELYLNRGGKRREWVLVKQLD
jgi:hypothetical protein